MKLQIIILWAARLTAAVIMLQSLYFKFTAAPESVYIFSTIGAEPVGRIGSGIIELVASMLLLLPRFSWIGALLGAGVMLGAIATHLTVLGIAVQGDGGWLFILALITLISCTTVLFISRAEIPFLPRWLAPNRFFAAASVLWLLTGCVKDQVLVPVGNTGAPVSVAEPTKTFDSTGQKLLSQGVFMNAVHAVKGSIKLYEKDGKRTLVFENFSSDAGPDLRIYLSESTTNRSFVEADALRNTGNFFVELPDTVEVDKHRHVLIWCKPFSVLFGYAELK